MKRNYDESSMENAAARPDPMRVRNGLTKCVYLSNRADVIIKALGMRFRRSDSAVLSLLAEKYGKGILKAKEAKL
jgi:hypothetical protein